jgi:hypothetical protein
VEAGRLIKDGRWARGGHRQAREGRCYRLNVSSVGNLIPEATVLGSGAYQEAWGS